MKLKSPVYEAYYDQIYLLQEICQDCLVERENPLSSDFIDIHYDYYLSQYYQVKEELIEMQNEIEIKRTPRK